MTDLDQLKTDALTRIENAPDAAALEALRIEFLGKQGSISGLMKTLGGMSPEERQVQGPLLNGLRTETADAIAARKEVLENAELEARLAGESIDLTLPAPEAPRGSVHPVSQVMDELAEIFADLGFSVATGPEVEDDWHNFTALNMAETHPARAMHDTFYFPQKHVDHTFDNAPNTRMLLRTHTSPVQIRSLVERGAPIRIIAPGRVYRSDSDATHTPMFHQVEGLVIDKGIHLGHLKWTLETFLKAFFERDDIVLRLRPSYFPFTEPSVEVDVGWEDVNGRKVLGGDGDAPGHGWMELLGSGMVNRRVIESAGLDPDEWQGFAWGLGVDRLHRRTRAAREQQGDRARDDAPPPQGAGASDAWSAQEGAAQMWTTGHVSVRVMPSRFCTFETTSLPSSSTLRASARTMTS